LFRLSVHPWNFPKGLLEEGEQPLDAAIRELLGPDMLFRRFDIENPAAFWHSSMLRQI
jgi:hypothetical protein